MCKLLIILGIGMLLTGCATAQKSLEKSAQTHPADKTSQEEVVRGAGCHMLTNGYLICAKTPR